MVVRVMCDHTASAECRPPRVPLYEKLGELRVCEERLVRALGSHPREAMKEREDIVRIDGARKGRLDLST
jgi:hypothetical protein